MNLDEKFRQYKLNTYLPEEETMQRPEALPSPDIVSQLVTEGVSSVVSDIEKMPAQSLYALGKGAIEGAVGTPGDLISIIKGIYYASNTPEGKNKLDEFTRGMESSTVLPTTEDVKKFINELVPQLQTKATAAESTGELLAPSGLATYATKNVVKGVKKITKVLK
jgi:hypothetical protein